MDFSADLAIFYADFGKAARLTRAAGGAPVDGRVLLDEGGVAVVGGEVLACDLVARHPVATFGQIRRGDQLLIAGKTYTAREHGQPVDDGLEHTVPLARS